MSWIHLHLALNHLPVVGTLFVFVLLLVGICRGSEEFKRFALHLSLVMFVIAMIVKYTGDWAEDEKDFAPNSEYHELVEAHEQSADQAVTGMFLLAVFSAAGLFCSRKSKILPAWATIGTALLAFVALLLMARSANFGARINHPEVRPQSSAVDFAPAGARAARHNLETMAA